MLLGLVLLLVLAGWLVLRLPPFGGRLKARDSRACRSSPQWHGRRFENSLPRTAASTSSGRGSSTVKARCASRGSRCP